MWATLLRSRCAHPCLGFHGSPHNAMQPTRASTESVCQCVMVLGGMRNLHNSQARLLG